MSQRIALDLTDREVGLVVACLLERRNRASHSARDVGPPWKDYWRKRAHVAQVLIDKLRDARKAANIRPADTAKKQTPWICGHCGKRVSAQYDVCECGDTRHWGTGA